MAFSFCTQCGNKMTYTVSPPNFCGKCGTLLNGSVAKKISAPNKTRDDFEDDEESEEFSNSDELPSISSLAYEIENDSGNRNYQLGELFGQPKIFSRKRSPMSLAELKDKNAKT